jgi:hypothetical protein
VVAYCNFSNASNPDHEWEDWADIPEDMWPAYAAGLCNFCRGMGGVYSREGIIDYYDSEGEELVGR